MKTRWMMMAGLMALSGMAQAAFVTIGNAGNAADTTGYGRVDYTYQISATEVTIAEFAASGAGSGNENYWNDGVRSVGTAAPAVNVSLYEAMKYCNWLTSGDINLGAYVFSGGVYQSTDRASAISTYRTVYALPTEDEWYKAAYFRLDASGYSLYANGTGTAPVAGTDANYTDYFKWVAEQPWVVETGTAEQNGTYDMMGNVWEWLEDPVLRSGTFFVNGYYLRSSTRNSDDLMYEDEGNAVGFRVVAIPEPASAMMLIFGAGVGMVIHRLRRTAMCR